MHCFYAYALQCMLRVCIGVQHIYVHVHTWCTVCGLDKNLHVFHSMGCYGVQ